MQLENIEPAKSERADEENEMKSKVYSFCFCWSSTSRKFHRKTTSRHFQLPCKLFMVRMNENQTNLEFNLNSEIRMEEKRDILVQIRLDFLWLMIRLEQKRRKENSSG